MAGLLTATARLASSEESRGAIAVKIPDHLPPASCAVVASGGRGTRATLGVMKRFGAAAAALVGLAACDERAAHGDQDAGGPHAQRPPPNLPSGPNVDGVEGHGGVAMRPGGSAQSDSLAHAISAALDAGSLRG